jgi:hypothetical protein
LYGPIFITSSSGFRVWMIMNCVVNEMELNFFNFPNILRAEGLRVERPLMIASKIAN